MIKHVQSCLVLIALTFFTSSFAGIIHVPNDTTSIQGGIHLANIGDTVLVNDGTYIENINFKGKAITVASLFIMDGDTNHIDNTIINGSQPSHPDSGSVVRFVSDEDTTSVLCGFTITGGTGTRVYRPLISDWAYDGGGILLFEAGGKIISNKVINNHINQLNNYISGGGITVETNQNPQFVVIRNNNISSNTVTGRMPSAGGVALFELNGNVNVKYILEQNRIINNIVTCPDDWRAMGGGIAIQSSLPSDGIMVIRNNIISGNQSRCVRSFGGGIFVLYLDNSSTTIDQSPNTFILNNIVSDNYSEYVGGGISIWRWPGYLGGPPPNSGKDIVPQPAIINNTIVDNSASAGYGLFVCNQIPLFMNNILWNKNSPVSGSAIYIGRVLLLNGLLWQNPYGDIEHYNSIIQGSDWTDMNRGVFGIEPAFSDPLYHLTAASSCVGIGRSTLILDSVSYSAPPYDLKGNPRPSSIDTMVDIGVYESPYPCILVHPISFSSSISKTYLNPAIDSILATADIINPANHNMDIYAKIESLDQMDVDSTLMYDDGLHDDGAANDGLYGGTFDPIQVENEFNKLGISINDQQTGYRIDFYDPIQFTTIGSLVIENFTEVSRQDFGMFLLINYQLSIRNTGSVKTAEDVLVTISTTDTFVYGIQNNDQNFGDIPAGQSVTAPQTFNMMVIGAPNQHEMQISANIYSHEELFWHDTTSTVVGITKGDEAIPKAYALDQNYPNPFNPTTTIEFDLPKTSKVTLKVFNILGEEVTTLVSDRLSAGSYSYEWDASHLASGVYIYRLQAEGFVQTRKMILMK